MVKIGSTDNVNDLLNRLDTSLQIHDKTESAMIVKDDIKSLAKEVFSKGKR